MAIQWRHLIIWPLVNITAELTPFQWRLLFSMDSMYGMHLDIQVFPLESFALLITSYVLMDIYYPIWRLIIFCSDCAVNETFMSDSSIGWRLLSSSASHSSSNSNFMWGILSLKFHIITKYKQIRDNANRSLFALNLYVSTWLLKILVRLTPCWL